MKYPKSIIKHLETFTPEQQETLQSLVNEGYAIEKPEKTNAEHMRIGALFSSLNSDQQQTFYFILGAHYGARQILNEENS